MTTQPQSLSTSLRRPFWVAAVLLGFFLTAQIRADDADDKGTHFTSVVIPAGLDGSDVQSAIVTTLKGRGWGVKSKADGQVVGYLKHRSSEATVTLAYDATKVEIYCVGYKIDKASGAREKPEQPVGWLKNLQVDLTGKLNKTVTSK